MYQHWYESYHTNIFTPTNLYWGEPRDGNPIYITMTTHQPIVRESHTRDSRQTPDLSIRRQQTVVTIETRSEAALSVMIGKVT